MRSILITVVLIIVIIVIYNQTIGGEDGAGANVVKGGNIINLRIESINP